MLDPLQPEWKKSSYSTGTGQECVEVFSTKGETIGIRDSKMGCTNGIFLKNRDWVAFISDLDGF